MEFVEGQTLGEWAGGDLRPNARAILDKYLQAGRGLAAAHKAGLVHRDFKPSNVIVDEHGCARVLDFGLVAGAGDVSEIGSDTSERLGALDVELTTTGTLLGTPAYMAPEQFAGARVDARTDQFGFCVALFEVLTGSRPFAGSTTAELWTNVSEGLRTRSTQFRVRPRRLARALDRGLATDPDQRWPSMEALLDALRPVSRLQIAAAVTAVVIPVAGVGGWTMIDSYERQLDAQSDELDAQSDELDAQSDELDAGQREIAVVRIADGRELFRVPGQLWPSRSAKTREGEHGLVLDLATFDRGLVTLPLSVPGLVDAACDLLERSELAERTSSHCGG